jgi:hypothetical protein
MTKSAENLVSVHLPFDLRAALVRAAQTPVTRSDPLARRRAIDEVTARAKRVQPYLFREL